MSALLGWGPFRFETGRASFEELRHRFGARWEKHPVIGRRPAGQYLGPHEETVSIRGTIYPRYTGQSSAQQIADLMRAAGQGETYTLILQDGSLIGIFRLEKAERILSHIDPAGAAEKITYDFEFCAHDDDAREIFGLWP